MNMLVMLVFVHNVVYNVVYWNFKIGIKILKNIFGALGKPNHMLTNSQVNLFNHIHKCVVMEKTLVYYLECRLYALETIK